MSVEIKKGIFRVGLLTYLTLQTTFASGLLKAEAPYINLDFGLDQFYQILPDLARNGATAYDAQLSPVESTQVRGEQLLEPVDDIITLAGTPKVNLIGHSHGSPTIRYIHATVP